jgi:hypothetical protein
MSIFKFIASNHKSQAAFFLLELALSVVMVGFLALLIAQCYARCIDQEGAAVRRLEALTHAATALNRYRAYPLLGAGKKVHEQDGYTIYIQILNDYNVPNFQHITVKAVWARCAGGHDSLELVSGRVAL